MLIPNANFIAFKNYIQTSLGKFCQQNTFEEQKSAIKVLKTKEREKERMLPSCFNKIFIYNGWTKKKKKKGVISISFHDNQWKSLTHLLSLVNLWQTCQGKQGTMPCVRFSGEPEHWKIYIVIISSAPLTAQLEFFSSEILGDGEVLTAFLWEQMHPRSASPAERPQLSHFMTCFILSGFIKTFSHLCGWLTPWRWPILSLFAHLYWLARNCCINQ